MSFFDERADLLTFNSTVTVDHIPAEEFALTPDDPAYFYPFLYDPEEFPDLRQFVTPNYADPDGKLSDCKVVENSAAGKGFDKAALCVAAFLPIGAKTGTIRVPLKFQGA